MSGNTRKGCFYNLCKDPDVGIETIAMKNNDGVETSCDDFEEM